MEQQNQLKPIDNKLALSEKWKALPTLKRERLDSWRKLPSQSYETTPVLSINDIINLETPTLGDIKNYIDPMQAEMVIGLAINEICNFVNVGQQMSSPQKALTAKLICKRFWYFKPEDIKACFYERLTNEKLYILDGQTFLRWLGEYDLKRANACEDEAIGNNIGYKQDDNAISHAVYKKMLESKATAGDKDSIEKLSLYKRRESIKTPWPIEKEQEYRLFRHKYIMKKEADENS